MGGRTDRQTERRDEANNLFLQYCNREDLPFLRQIFDKPRHPRKKYGSEIKVIFILGEAMDRTRVAPGSQMRPAQ